MTTFPPPETLLTIESLVSFLDGVFSKPFNWRVFIQDLDNLCGLYIEKDQKDLLLVLLGYMRKHTKQHDMRDIILKHIRRCIVQCNPMYLFLLLDSNQDIGLIKRTHFVPWRGDMNLLEFAYHCELTTMGKKPMFNQVIHGLMQRGWSFLSNKHAGSIMTRVMFHGSAEPAKRNRLLRNLDGIRMLFILASVYPVKRLGLKSALVKVKLPLDVIRRLKDFLM